MSFVRRIFRGGVAVTTGQVAGSILSLVAALVYSRRLGPSDFAIYAICAAWSAFLRVAARMGANARLITRRVEPTDQAYNASLYAMLLSSMVVCVLASCILPLFQRLIRVENLLSAALVTVWLIPLHVVSLPALARLERKLRFGWVMAVELSAQMVGLAIGTALVFHGFGVWGPVAGWIGSGICQSILPWVIIGSRPAPYWHRRYISLVLQYGAKYTVAAALVHARNLVLLSAVGKFFGQESVGLIALCQRAVNLALPFKAAATRVLLPALSSVAAKRKMFANVLLAVAESEVLLTLPIALVATGLYGPVVKLVLGHAWIPTIPYFPWVMASTVLAAAFGSSLTALHSQGHFLDSILSSCSVIAAYVVSACFVSSIPSLGCAVVLVVSWPGFWMQGIFAKKRFGAGFDWGLVLISMGGASACFVAVDWRISLCAVMVFIFPFRYRVFARASFIVKGVFRKA